MLVLWYTVKQDWAPCDLDCWLPTPYGLETVDTDDATVDDPVDVNWTAEAQGNLLL